MIYILYYILTALGLTYVLWLFYLAVMCLSHAKKKGQLTTITRILSAPIVVTGLLIDALVNIFVVTLLLLELPKEWTVTDRFQRHYWEGNSKWRKSVVEFFKPILDPFDPDGTHI